MDTFDRDLLKNYQHFQIPVDKGSTVEYMHQDNLNEIGFNVCRRNIHVAKGQKVLIGEDKKHEIDTNEILRKYWFYKLPGTLSKPKPSLPPPKKKNPPQKYFLYFGKWNSGLFIPSSKNKKVHPKKISYLSGNGNPEKISYIFSKESRSYISEIENLKKLVMFQETNALKKLLIFNEVTFRAQKMKKSTLTSYISGNGTFKPQA